jgi:succinate dehydrogenase / fumarate reductase, membrane anchor subunit
MVTNVTSLTGNGLKDWLIQRVTAVFFAIYSLFLLGFLMVHPNLHFSVWHDLCRNTVFQIATVLALLMMVLHAWIGIWTVTTDYITKTAIRLSIQIVVFLLLLTQFVWGLMIIWGQ